MTNQIQMKCRGRLVRRIGGGLSNLLGKSADSLFLRFTEILVGAEFCQFTLGGCEIAVTERKPDAGCFALEIGWSARERLLERRDIDGSAIDAHRGLRLHFAAATH